MSHREQHFAGLHYANGSQIGASTTNHTHRENSPNSPSNDTLEKIRARVYGDDDDDYNDDYDEDDFAYIFDPIGPS